MSAPKDFMERSMKPGMVLRMRHFLRLGGLPTVLILGAQKAGTSSLFGWLSKHPSVARPLIKEVHYFDNSYEKTRAWYEAHFLSSKTRIGVDASPYYLFHPRAPLRAFEVVPSAKLIVILRDPAERAFSQYRMNVRRGQETETFDDAIDLEAERLGNSHEELRSGRLNVSLNHQLYSYASRGFYADQIREWMARYHKSQFLFLSFDDLKRRPGLVMERTFDFLGIERLTLEGLRPLNQGDASSMGDGMRRKLETLFEPANKDLFQLTGVSFS